MDISLFAVGRMKKGAEAELVSLYTERFAAAAGSLGLQFGGIREVAESRRDSAEQRKREEFAALEAHLKADTLLILLDERGKTMPSRRFAEDIGRRRDEGHSAVLFALGGPDGFAAEARQRADMTLSFGAMTWPHRLARIMLAEQLYRAAMILAGHPYHRD